MIIKKITSLFGNFLSGLLMLLCLLSCAAVNSNSQSPAYSADIAAVLAGQKILGRELTPGDLPDLDLFAITPEMQAFAEQAVRPAHTIYEKVKALHYALLLPLEEGGRGIVYNAHSTQTPIVAFQERRVNCLSFSLMYVALANHLKLRAEINEVQTPPVWNLRNKDSLFLMRHVNVKVPLYDERFYSGKIDEVVVDLEMGRYKSTYSQGYISDALAAAQFYSNRGMELATDGNRQQAFLYLRKALQQDNQQSYIWNNFASFYVQQALLHEAEVIYLHGLQLNPEDLSVISNLAGLYRKMGNSQGAERYSRLAQRYRQANPYYQYTLALSAFDNEDYSSALFYVKRAIKRKKEAPQFYQLASSIFTKLGDPDAAALMNKKYDKLQRNK